MSKLSRSILIIVVLILLAGSLSLLPRIISEGRKHVETASLARQAGEAWQNGNTIGALTKFVTVIGMMIEGGMRSMLAQPYLERSSKLNQQAKLQEALDSCIKAVRLLGKYDDEGSVGYYCSTIEVQIQFPQFMPTRVATPLATVQP